MKATRRDLSQGGCPAEVLRPLWVGARRLTSRALPRQQILPCLCLPVRWTRPRASWPGLLLAIVPETLPGCSRWGTLRSSTKS